MYNQSLFPTKSGTPQGGIISPTLANLTLNGLGDHLKSKYWRGSTGRIHKRFNKHKLNITVYADDFVVTANNKTVLEEVKIMISAFLKERGLELSQEKTVITNIDQGFNFLGWNFRKYHNKLIIKPSEESVKRIKMKIRKVVKSSMGIRQEDLISRLNPVIRGWCNYHNHICSKETFQKLDRYVFYQVWTWSKRRHSSKSKGWIKAKYFRCINSRDWIFRTDKFKLYVASDTKIIRHKLIKFSANPYLNENDDYYTNRAACRSYS